MKGMKVVGSEKKERCWHLKESMRLGEEGIEDVREIYKKRESLEWEEGKRLEIERVEEARNRKKENV